MRRWVAPALAAVAAPAALGGTTSGARNAAAATKVRIAVVRSVNYVAT